MTIEASITTTFSNDSTLNGIVSGRNYKGKIPQTPTIPYTFTQRTITLPQTIFEGSSRRINAHYQIDCYESSYSKVWVLARAVKAAMESATLFKAVWLNDIDQNWDDDLQVYRITSDYSIWWTE